MKKINNSEIENCKVIKEKLKFDEGYWIKVKEKENKVRFKKKKVLNISENYVKRKTEKEGIIFV